MIPIIEYNKNYYCNLITELQKFRATIGLKTRHMNGHEDYTHIYLMRDASNKLIKIGISKNPKVREKTLQSEKQDIDLIFTSPLMERENEKILHKKYEAKRVRGEWFDLNADDVNWVINFLKKDENECRNSRKNS